MDRKDYWVDNLLIERLWNTVKHEELCLREYRDRNESEKSLEGSYEK